MTREILSVDARGASEPEVVAHETDATGVDAAARNAAAASAVLAAASRTDRARLELVME